MAIGKRRTGESIPVIKYDARVGRLYTQDRVFEGGAWQTVQADCTDGFTAIFDLANLTQGWLAFPKGGQPLAVLFPAGAEIGDPPGDDYKQGFRVLVKMPDDKAGVREFMSSSIAAWVGVDELHDQFLAAAADHVGRAPMCELVDVHEIKNRGGGISYQPSFAIVDWIPRPVDLPETPAARPQPKAPAQRTPALAQPQPKAKAAPALDDEIPF